MSITVLPTPPSRSDPVNFAERADNFLSALPTFVTEANALASDVNTIAGQVSSDATTALNAQTSATASASTATSASGTAVSAASTASIKAAEALTSASNASSSFLSFDSRYLGPKASDPTNNNQGGVLEAGMSYWNTTVSSFKYYNGTTWEVQNLVADNFVNLTSNQTIAGTKTFSAAINVPAGATGTQAPRAEEVALLATTQIDGHRNKLINGNFEINQQEVSGTVVLSAGQYGHDMWKAGASGCTYTFSYSQGITTITITAGSLIQVIEGKNLRSGAYVLSWAGTAQGRIGTNAYSSSGVNAFVTGGANLNIEFNTGTLGLTQFEPGVIPTVYGFRLDELSLCLPHFFRISTSTAVGAYYSFAIGEVNSTSTIVAHFPFPARMRAVPTMSGQGLDVSAGGALRAPTVFTYDFASVNGCRLNFGGMSGLTLGWACRVVAANSNTSYIQGSARL